MNPRSENFLLGRVKADRYAGRLDHIERLYLHAISGSEPYSVRVSGPPGVGTSELLRQVYDRLFREQRFVIPFYFAIRSGDRNGHAAASRYAYEFLLQAIAFRRNDPTLLAASPNICELAKLAPLADAEWVDRMCEVCRSDGPLNDERAFIRSALASPFRFAAEAGMPVCVMIDDLHEASAIDRGSDFLDDLSSVSANVRSPLILGTRRSFSIDEHSRPSIEIGPLPRDDAAILVETLAADAGVVISEQTRDLIAVQSGGNPLHISSLIYAASDKKRGLDTYRDVEQIYAEELLTGRIGDHFDKIFSRAAPEPKVRRELIEMLYLAIETGGDRFPLNALQERLTVSREDFSNLARSLVLDEVIFVEGSTAAPSHDNLLHDFLETRYQLGVERNTLATVAASAITNALKRALRLMARVYRSEDAVGLRDLMLLFDVQDVPRVLLDYRMFRDRYKGISDDEAKVQLSAENDVITLPQISHAEPVVDHFKQFGNVIEPDRAIVGIGFADRAYRDEDQIAWLAAEIDSKLEADHALTLEWCDRLEAAAKACGFSNYRIWLVAPEGFSDGALELLSERNVIGSSRRQIVFLRKTLQGESGGENEALEYEIVIPVGEDTELIAAHALEEISRRYNFPVKTVNQIKTALVEACINATEHSLTPDRKIYQKFAIDNEKIVVTVSNRGIRLADKLSEKQVSEREPTDGRRGWGLGLMRSLMDEVRIESVDDGTRIVMTKYVKA